MSVFTVLYSPADVSACQIGYSSRYWLNHFDERPEVGTEGQNLTGTFFDIFGVGPDIDLMEILTYQEYNGTECLNNQISNILNSNNYSNWFELWGEWNFAALEKYLNDSNAEKTFLQQAVTSLFNSSSPGFTDYWKTWDVIALVRAVYPGGGCYGGITEPQSLDWWKNYLDRWNY